MLKLLKAKGGKMTTKTSNKPTASAKTRTKSKSVSITATKETTKTDVNKKTYIKEKTKNIWEFIKGINKAYYVAALAIIVSLIYFLPWINIVILAKIATAFNMPYLATDITLPQSLIALFSNIDPQITNVNNFLDLIDLSDRNGEALRQLQSIIRSVAPMLGINLGSAVNIDDVMTSIKSVFPSPEKILAAKVMLEQVTMVIKTVFFSALLFSIVLVGFNVYTAIYCFVKRRVNRICTIGFFVEGVLALIIIVGVFVVNTVVHSHVAFINQVLAPTFWTWATFILCLGSIIAIFKMTKKDKPKNKKKLVITLVICLAVVVIATVIFAVCSNNKKAQYYGNWCLEQVSSKGVIDQSTIDKINDKSEAFVITVNNDDTFEACLVGADITGTYKQVAEGIVLAPTSGNSQDIETVTLKFNSGKLTASIGPLDFATMRKFDKDAATACKDVRRALGMAALDYAMYMAGIDEMSAEDVVKTLEKFSIALNALESVDKDRVIQEVKGRFGEQLKKAYDKLNDNQKSAVNGVYVILIK